MISLDLIEFADLVRPIDIADQVFKQNNWINSAVPLEEIAKAAGIKDIQYAPLKSFEGTLLANDAKTEGVIVINSDARHERRRFTLGHELGHFMIPRHGHKMQCSKSDLSMSTSVAIEAEANQFAAELLMPKRLLSKLSFFNKEPSIEGIKLAAEKFDVSFQAMALRFVNIHDYPIAFVMSRNGKVEYGYK